MLIPDLYEYFRFKVQELKLSPYIIPLLVIISLIPDFYEYDILIFDLSKACGILQQFSTVNLDLMHRLLKLNY